MKYRLLAVAIGWLSCWTGVAAGADPSLVFDPAGSTRIVKQLIFTKDGSQLVSVGADRVIRIWEVQTAKTVRTIRDQVSACDDCRVSTIALSPDNKYLAAGGTFPGADPDTRFAIYIYNFENGQRITLLKGHKAPVTALAFSRSGTQLASGSFVSDLERRTDVSGSVRTWKIGAQGWEANKTLSQHEEAVASVAFSPDESQLVSSSHGSDVVLWNLQTGEPKVLQGHSDFVYGAIFSPDGQFIVSAGWDRKICLWDSKGAFVQALPPQPAGITSLAVSPNKDRFRILVGLANGESRILSVPDGMVIAKFNLGKDNVFAATVSVKDENILASAGGHNGEFWVWRADNPNEAKLFAGKGQTVWKVGFANDGESIAFGTQHVGDAPNGYGRLEQVIRLKSGISQSANQISPRSLTYRISLGGPVENGADYYSEIEETKGAGNSTYKLKTRYTETVKRTDGGVDPVRLTELKILKDNQKFDEIKRDSTSGRTHRAFTFTRDGRYVISAGEDGYLALYQTSDPSKPLHLFKGHTSDVWSVAVSPDGRFVVSGSSDQTIKLWNIKYEQCLVSFFVGSDSEWIAWTPQGYYTSSLRGDRYIGWQVEETVEKQKQLAVYAADRFEKVFHRPEVVSQYIDVPDINEAVRETPIISFADHSLPVDRLTVVTPEAVKKSLPPKITIISPDDTERFRQRLIPVKVFVTSDNLPITDVIISLNGFVKGTFKGDGTESSKKVAIETTVALKPDKNILVVVATNGSGSSETETQVFYEVAPPPTAPGQIKPASFAGAVQGWDSSSQTRWSHGKSAVQKFFHTSSNVPLSPVPFEAAPKTVVPDDPPTFEILSPKETTPLTTSNEFVPMEIRIGTVPPNTKLRITVNDSVRENSDVHSGDKYEGQVYLDQNRQNIVAVMTNTNGVDSAPQTRIITTRAAQTKPNLIFLGIGVSNYSNLNPPLQYGDKDAIDLERLLCKLKNSSIFAEVKTKVLSNADATKPKILEAVAWLNGEAKSENDLRVVLVSGHGGVWGQSSQQYYFFAQNQMLGGDPEESSTNWHLVLKRLLDSKVNYGQGHLLLLIDTCRAGSASPSVSLDFASYGGLVYFGSSASNADSFETNGNGVFTRAVLEGLGGNADYTKDGQIDHDELWIYLKRRVKDLNKKQTVQEYFSKGLDLVPIGAKELPAPPAPPISCRKDPKP